MGKIILKTGLIGDIKIGRQTYTCEVRSLSQMLNQSISNSYSPSCSANLYDSKCKVVKDLYKYQGHVINPIDRQNIQVSNLTLPNEHQNEATSIMMLCPNVIDFCDDAEHFYLYCPNHNLISGDQVILNGLPIF